MDTPATNYLKNTLADSEERFVKIIHQCDLFKDVPDELLHQIFQYAKFVKLHDKQRCIEEGMFNQEIYILIDGALNIFVKNDEGAEEKIDMMHRPFTLFGERCILGEPRGATAESLGETLLLGIDLSSLPDVIDAVENPEKRNEAPEYAQNVIMYSLFGDVLTKRLARLIHDQYKLKQKEISIRKYSATLKKERLSILLFNQFFNNDLHPDISIGITLRELLKSQNIEVDSLKRKSLGKVNTKEIYIEMAKLHAMGKIENLNQLMFSLLNRLTMEAQQIPVYMEAIESNVATQPEPLGLSEYALDVWNALEQSGVYRGLCSREEFIGSLFYGESIQPLKTSKYLKRRGVFKNEFDEAYFWYLVCETSLTWVGKVNHLIAEYVRTVRESYSPKQQRQNSATDQELIQSFEQLYLESTNDVPVAETTNVVENEQESVDELLSKLGF